MKCNRDLADQNDQLTKAMKRGEETIDRIRQEKIKTEQDIKTEHQNEIDSLTERLEQEKLTVKALLDDVLDNNETTKTTMYIMHKRGINGALWEATEILNKDLNAKIRTKYGNTRTINIRDSIRQGGVLSVTQYAALMDKIHRNITEVNLVKREKNNDPTCLLWVDDVAIITNNLHDQQKLLDITSETANRLCIEFGKEKS